MEYSRREYFEAVFGGDMPPQFEIDHDLKLKMFHALGGTGPLPNFYEFELLWDYREFLPFNRSKAFDLVDDPVSPIEDDDEEVEDEIVTWDTIEEGNRVATFLNGQLKRGEFLGFFNKEKTKVKVAFNGDEKAYRILQTVDVEPGS